MSAQNKNLNIKISHGMATTHFIFPAQNISIICQLLPQRVE